MSSGLLFVVYIDAFYLGSPVYFPHFLYVSSCHPSNFTVVDTSYGQEKEINSEQLGRRIWELEYQLLWSPIGLTIESSLSITSSSYS